MTDSVELRLNKATQTEIADHLAQSDDAFSPRLSERVEISDYAQKIVGRAERFEAWARGELVGLVAAYCKDSASGKAYITNVSVIPGYRNRGLASRLLAECVDFVRARQFERVSLEVDQENQPAVDLYEAAGFAVVGVIGRTIQMDLDTREDTHNGGHS